MGKSLVQEETSSAVEMADGDACPGPTVRLSCAGLDPVPPLALSFSGLHDPTGVGGGVILDSNKRTSILIVR